MVYGILSLVSPEKACKIAIDYGIKAKDLYKQIAPAKISRIGLDILYFAQIRPRNRPLTARRRSRIGANHAGMNHSSITIG
jgi:hypothetical protein